MNQYSSTAKSASANTSNITRRRFQYLGGLIICVYLPAFIRSGNDFYLGDAANQHASALGAFIAFTASFIAIRILSGFPGVRAGAHVPVAVIGFFSLVMLAFFMLRIEYSRFMFLMSFGATLVWFVALHIATLKLVSTTFATVPGGTNFKLSASGDVKSFQLQKPEFTIEFLKNQVDGIVANLHHEFTEDWQRFLAQAALAGLPVYHYKQIEESITGKVQIEHLSENQFGSLLPSMFYLKSKALIDWFAAILLLPVFFLVLLIVGPMIKLTSKGPIFYAQDRMGAKGDHIRVVKFRTMTDAPEPETKAATLSESKFVTVKDDARITKFGKFLRKYRIDEFPQIINILKGEMSWIGPRPEAIELSESYEAELPFYAYRHVVKPGISGWAQVHQGHVTSSKDVHEKLHYDFFYIKYLSPWLDFLIVLKTLNIVFTGAGSK